MLLSCIMPCQMCPLCLRWNVCGMHGVCSWQPSESEQVTTSPGNTCLTWDFELSSVPVLNLYHCQDWEGTLKYLSHIVNTWIRLTIAVHHSPGQWRLEPTWTTWKCHHRMSHEILVMNMSQTRLCLARPCAAPRCGQFYTSILLGLSNYCPCLKKRLCQCRVWKTCRVWSWNFKEIWLFYAMFTHPKW